MQRPPPGRNYSFYREALRGKRLPLAFVDMDLFDANARALADRARGMPMRIATKSVRCTALLRYLLDTFPEFQGLMAFSAAEAAFLAEQGFDDILIGYPTLEPSEIDAALQAIKAGRRIVFMVDHVAQAALLDERAKALACSGVPICLDVDLSTKFPLLHFGVFRSPLQHEPEIKALLLALDPFTSLQITGLMGYEAQIAGVPDHIPGAWFYSLIVRTLKALSLPRCFQRRRLAAAAITSHGAKLSFVNGGGTGSIEVTRRDPTVTELTVGSGLFSPTLFDHFQEFRYFPAAGFALPVVRQAQASIYACSGGGYIASGQADKDKQPVPYLPEGVHLIKNLGAGEVQTSVVSQQPLTLGDPLFFRHAKAGELCERFATLHLIRGGKVEEQVATYRGQGQCFF